MTGPAGARASRIALGVLVVAAPGIITCALLAALFDATLFDYFPLVSDEIAYQRQIAAFVATGFDGGYFTTFERPAPLAFTHFSVHGPAFPVIYGLIGRLAGWELYSGPIFNLAVLALATAAFLVMGRLSRAQMLATGGVLVTSWWLILMATITMQESLNQAVMIVIAGFTARLLHPETRHHERLLGAALALLAIAAVLRPTNWIVAVPLVLVGLPRHRPRRLMLAAGAAALGIPAFWLLWRYVSAPIPSLAIELGPVTSGGAVGTIARYFLGHLRDNAEIFGLAPFVGAPFLQHVMFETVAVAVLCVPLAAVAAWQRGPAVKADLFNLLTLGLGLVAFLGFYFDSEASLSRVTAPFLMLALLVYVAAGERRWLVAIVIAANVVVAPSFVATFKMWRVDMFTGDRARYERFRAELQPVLAFDPRRTPWCNTLLTTTYEREIVAVPAGIGLSVGRPAENLVPPIRSGYVLLTADSVTPFGGKARLQFLATTVLGDLYANRDAGCDRE